jgi:hypothetical protein
VNSDWPEAVADFKVFCSQAGLVCQRREEHASFGNKMVQYGSASVGLRVVSDRGIWFVEVADFTHHPNEWYDAAILRDLLIGPGADVLTLPDQIEFVEMSWPQILSGFGSERNIDTHERLARLRGERLRRRLPQLFRQT